MNWDVVEKSERRMRRNAIEENVFELNFVISSLKSHLEASAGPSAMWNPAATETRKSSFAFQTHFLTFHIVFSSMLVSLYQCYITRMSCKHKHKIVHVFLLFYGSKGQFHLTLHQTGQYNMIQTKLSVEKSLEGQCYVASYGQSPPPITVYGWDGIYG